MEDATAAGGPKGTVQPSISFSLRMRKKWKKAAVPAEGLMDEGLFLSLALWVGYGRCSANGSAQRSKQRQEEQPGIQSNNLSLFHQWRGKSEMNKAWFVNEALPAQKMKEERERLSAASQWNQRWIELRRSYGPEASNKPIDFINWRATLPALSIQSPMKTKKV